jgi:nucleotide-binding universal stress UspA family protein
MAIVTTVITTPALAVVYPQEQLRADLLVAEATEASRRVLIPVSLPSSGPALLDMAIAVSDGALQLYALHLARPTERGALGARVFPHALNVHEALGPLLARAQARNCEVHPLELVSRAPGKAICEVAQAKGVGLVVMGWHKPVFNQAMLGGAVQQVMKESAADVAVFIEKGGIFPPGRLLLPYTGTRHDRAALTLAARLVRRYGTQATILHVVRPGRAQPQIEQEAQEALAQEFPEPGGGVTRLVVVESATPVETVLQEASRYDLTLLGVGEEWNLAPHVFGLRQERIVSQCPSSLLIVRAHP